MSRWLWVLAALSAAVVAAVLAVAWPGGPGGGESYAGFVEEPYAFIDKDITNGDGPCDPDYWDDSSVETVGSTHKLAVCVADLPAPVGGFYLAIRYDDELDECDDEDCTDGLCRDDNPDANVGVTTWGSALGAGWDCEIEGEPMCDGDSDTGPQEGLALIWCEGPEDSVPSALGDAESQNEVDDGDNWAALAVLTLDVAAAGTDEVIIDHLEVWGPPGTGLMGSCYGDNGVFTQTLVQDGMECYGAKDKKRPPSEKPTPTPTATEVPPTATSVPPTATPPPIPTATPFGGPAGVGIVPPPTGGGPSGGDTPWTLMASLLAGSAGAAIAAGGLLRFAKGRRR